MPPLRFLIVSTTLVAMLHAYIGWRLLANLGWPDTVACTGWVLLLLSTLLLPLAFIARGIAHHALRDSLSWIAMTCMGVFSSLLVFTLLRDLLLFALAGLHALARIEINFAGIEQRSVYAVLLLTLVISVLGFFNARALARIVHINVPIRNLPPALASFRIVQISDIHVGPTIKHDYLARIVARVNQLQADMVAITGDLVDGQVHELAAHIRPLAALTARHGSFFVTGNHEYYAGALAWISELQGLGVQVLLNEHVQLRHGEATLVVAGVTDYSAEYFYTDHRSDPHAAVAGAPDNTPKILLAHQPRSAEAAQAAGFDLQLSGHTHGGQFWPWQYFVPLQQPFVAGLHRWQDLWVYVSRGTGYWGPPVRFTAPSEITCLTLTLAKY